jgi:hypothetical protein
LGADEYTILTTLISGADFYVIAQLRYGVNDQSDREVAPFRLPGIRLSASESVEMEAIIEKRLSCHIWRELSLEQGRREQYVSREFVHPALSYWKFAR